MTPSDWTNLKREFAELPADLHAWHDTTDFQALAARQRGLAAAYASVDLSPDATVCPWPSRALAWRRAGDASLNADAWTMSQGTPDHDADPDYVRSFRLLAARAAVAAGYIAAVASDDDKVAEWLTQLLARNALRVSEKVFDAVTASAIVQHGRRRRPESEAAHTIENVRLASMNLCDELVNAAPKTTAPERMTTAVVDVSDDGEPVRAYFTVMQVAKRLQVDEETVRREIDRGKLPAHLVGSNLRINGRDLIAYEGSQTKTAKPAPKTAQRSPRLPGPK